MQTPLRVELGGNQRAQNLYLHHLRPRNATAAIPKKRGGLSWDAVPEVVLVPALDRGVVIVHFRGHQGFQLFGFFQVRPQLLFLSGHLVNPLPRGRTAGLGQGTPPGALEGTCKRLGREEQLEKLSKGLLSSAALSH